MSKKRTTGAVLAAVLMGAASAAEIEIVVGPDVYAAVLADHPGTASFMAQLPLSLKFEDYGSVERIAYLPKKLTVSGAPTSMQPQRGDLAYYIPWGNLAVFLTSFRESSGLMPMGRLPNDALEAIRRSGDRSVTIRARP